MRPADPAAKRALTRDEALACVPLVNPAVRTERNPSGQILLHYPAMLKPFPLRWIACLSFRQNQTHDWRRLQLDRLGTAVWELIDGARSVAQIIDLFAARYQLHPREAELSVTMFLKQLGKRGVIGLG